MSSISQYILHNDHHLVVVNKPSGIACARTPKVNNGMLEMAQAYTKCNLYLINRLDTPVSGILVFAKSKSSAKELNEQFKGRTIEKAYLAVSRFESRERSGEWVDELSKFSKQNRSDIVEKNGKTAVTEFERLESLDHVHLYLLKPKTGRHHQLRVQMRAHIGPIRGDQKYGDKRGNKDRSIDLHALAIKWVHPSNGKALKFVAPIPEIAPWVHFDKLKNKEDVEGFL